MNVVIQAGVCGLCGTNKLYALVHVTVCSLLRRFRRFRYLLSKLYQQWTLMRSRQYVHSTGMWINDTLTCLLYCKKQPSFYVILFGFVRTAFTFGITKPIFSNLFKTRLRALSIAMQTCLLCSHTLITDII